MAIDHTRERVAGWEWQAAVLHDLRTPLSVVSLQAQLLRRVANANTAPASKPVDLAMRVDCIERAVAQMAGMLDELQDIQWSDVSPPALQCERTDIVELARRSAEQAPEHRISVLAAEAQMTGSG